VHRFYISPNEWNPDALVLSGGEAHHARNVLRLEPGGKAVLFNGRGREITAEITEIDSRQIQLRKLHEASTPPLRCRISLAQAIPKGKNMDLIVQKAVEIGAAEIIPLVSARTVVQFDDESAAQKQAKWQTIAIEAAKQCGQNWLPQIHLPCPPNEFFDPAGAGQSAATEYALHPARLSPRHEFDLQLIGSLQSDALHLRKILADYSEHHQGLPERVLMLIGPEGDFTPAEISLARSRGCRPITLGPIILRVETAAIYCLSILSYELLV
jgi:16S rRNA (uracil1498-N3)-methyltransferase